MPGGDWSVLRRLIGTGPSPPTWPGPHDRRRVLIEGVTGPGQTGEPDEQVLACPGPNHLEVPCPAMAGQPCPLASGADTIVVRVADPALAERLADAHQRLHPQADLDGRGGVRSDGAQRVGEGAARTT